MSRCALIRLFAGAAAGLFALASFPLPAQAAPCPKVLVTVDNDDPGSGYSEPRPDNWQTHDVGACSGTYRYLSEYVGDLSTDGKAIWKPAIFVTGLYEVVTSYRATTNRTTDADYILYDDAGGMQKKAINQKQGSDCTKVFLGTMYCGAGGECRLVLDGTDDTMSDSADVTTFTRVDCEVLDGGPPPGPCDGIAKNPAFELWEETAPTCAGVFTNGAGCEAFCAAAGMECVARFGGEPGCQKEPENPIPCDAANGHASDVVRPWCTSGMTTIPCDASNGHASDWCECAAPSGAGAGAGGAGGAVGAGGGARVGGAEGGGAPAGSAGGSGPSAGPSTAAAGGLGAGGASASAATGAGSDAGAGNEQASNAENGEGSCSCRAAGTAHAARPVGSRRTRSGRRWRFVSGGGEAARPVGFPRSGRAW